MTTTIPDRTVTAPPSGIGASVPRPDGDLKTRGRFAFSSDLWAERMLWGHTLRSPHPHARIRSVDTAPARRMAGVHAVLTARDVPGRNRYGLMTPDQPVLADGVVRYHGEPLAIVAAETPELARTAAAAIRVEYDVLDVVADPAAAARPETLLLHPDGNVVRTMTISRGDCAAPADVIVTGTYTVGMQDQAPLGTESGLALPLTGGGVELFANTQWLHADRNQLAGILGIAPERILVRLAGVGGAFGAREDLSLQAHLCLLATATGRPVKMVYSREESFFGHVHRHPARMEYRHAATADGTLVSVQATILLDGGAYASTSPAVLSNAAAFAVGPYDCPNVRIDATVVYTNNPPCGAMRGFGAVQSAFAHEAQMDRVAGAAGVDPLEIRLRNAMTEGSVLPTGQPVTGRVPVRALLEELRDMRPAPDPSTAPGPLDLPGGTGDVTTGEGVRRGVGYAIGFKAGGMPEGVDDHTTARVALTADAGVPCVRVHTAAVEVGQGLTTIQRQIAQTELGVDDVAVLPADTSVGSAGSSSASRQTYMTGGAVRAACAAVRDRVLERAHERFGHRFPELLEGADKLRLTGGELVDADGTVLLSLAEILGTDTIEETRRYHHRPTTGLDPDTGQGAPHIQFIFAAHRATVDTDVETGLCRVAELGVAQDVGRAINPLAVEGQMEGGSAQGLGLALMEEIRYQDGRVVNPSFTDYLIPTILDVPPMNLAVLELPDEDAPYGVKGAGEPATISATPAIAGALRAATGRAIDRVPVRPDDLIAAQPSTPLETS